MFTGDHAVANSYLSVVLHLRRQRSKNYQDVSQYKKARNKTSPSNSHNSLDALDKTRTPAGKSLPYSTIINLPCRCHYNILEGSGFRIECPVNLVLRFIVQAVRC